MDKFDFNFYLKFTKPLVLNLPAVKDRSLASAWIKYLAGDDKIDPQVKLEHLKLLLFVLQRKRLAPPFNQHPNSAKKLEPLPKDKTVARDVIEDEQNQKREERKKQLKGATPKWPSYFSDFSADLLEYVSIQNIDNFGVHGYFAVSKEPLPMWYRVEKELLPTAAKSMLEVSPPPPAFLDSQSTPQLSEKSPEKAPESQPPVENPPAESPPKDDSVGRSKKPPKKSPLGGKPPSRPLGRVSPPSEDIAPPTWGSNLLEAKFLDEEVGDIIRDATNLDEFMPDSAATEVVASPMKVLYRGGAGPPPLASRFSRAGGASRSDDDPPPVVRPTRASLLLQKKKQQDRAHPQQPPKKSLRKPSGSKTKLPAQKKASKERVGSATRRSVPEFASPGTPVRGFAPDDDVDKYVQSFSQELSRMQSDYERQMSRYQDEIQKGPVTLESFAIVDTTPPTRPKVGRPSPQRILRSHALPEDPHISIGMSPEVKGFLAEGADTPTGTRHPSPRTPQGRTLQMPQEEEEESEDDEVAEQTGAGGFQAPPEYASMQGSAHKDSRLVKMFNETLDASMAIEDPLNSRGTPFKGFGITDVDQYVAEFRQELSRLQEDYTRQADQFQDEERAGGARWLPRPIPGANWKKNKTWEKIQRNINERKEEEERAGGVSSPGSPDDLDDDDGDIDLGQSFAVGGSKCGDPCEEARRLKEAQDKCRRAREKKEREDAERRRKEQERKDREAREERERQERERIQREIEAEARRKAAIKKKEEDERRRKQKAYEDCQRELKQWEEDERERLKAWHNQQSYGYDYNECAYGSAGAPSASDMRGLDLDEMDMDFANISGDNVERAGMGALQAPGDAEEDAEFEALERQFEAEMIAQAAGPSAPGDAEDDEFLALERQFEAEMIAQGAGPPAQGLDMDESQWTEAADFLDAADKKYTAQLTTGQRMRELFPGVEDDEDVELDQEILPSDFIQDREAKKLELMKEMFRQYYDSNPALSGVPVTVPRPTVSPSLRQRQREKIDRFFKSAVMELPKSPVQYKVDLPPSPPRTAEEMIKIPADIEEVASKYPPETYQFQYESPTKEYQQLRPIPKVDLAGVSPENQLWPTDFREMQKRFHGSPQKTGPDIFDLPSSERLMAQSPPRDWVPPVSPEVSPVDVERLKWKMLTESRVPGKGKPYKKKVQTKLRRALVTRYTQPTQISRQTILEEQEPPPYFTWEDEQLREDLAKHQRITRQKGFQFPYTKVRRLRGKRQPGLRNVREEYESPEHKRPDVIDRISELERASPIWTQDLPPGFGSPVSPYVPEIDTEQLAEEVEEGAFGPVVGPLQFPGSRHLTAEAMPSAGVRKTRGARPQLGYVSEAMEGLPESEWAHLGNITASSRTMPPKTFARPSRPPGLGKLPRSPIEYPPSPLARAPAPESPGRFGPQRRTLRKKLKKRRLDFSEEPTDEAQTEVTEVEAEVLDRDLIMVSTPPGGVPENAIHALRVARDLSPLRAYERPGQPQGTPRTPRRPTPPRSIMEEELPEVEDLPEFAPASPISDYGVLEGVMEEVKGHVPTQPRVPRGYVDLKKRWQKRPGRRLTQVTEVPLEEEVYRLHEQVESEVDEELAAQAAAQRAAEASILDEPVPGSLRSPMRLPVTVPFYETPPHLKYLPITRKPDMSVRDTANLLFGQPSYSLREQEQSEMAEFERMERVAEVMASEETPRPPGQANMYLLPDAARRVVERTAQDQYNQLRSPEKTLEQLYNEILAMPPSPGFLRQRKEAGLGSPTEFEYEQTIRERSPPPEAVAAAAAVRAQKPSKWSRPPKIPPKLKKPIARPSKKPAVEPPKPVERPKPAPKKKLKPAPPNRKPLYVPPPPKPRPTDKEVTSIPSKKSLKSTKSSTSGQSLRSGASQKSLTKKKKKAKAAHPPAEIDYDRAALQELGLTDVDLQNMNLMEAGPASPSLAAIAAQYGDDAGLDIETMPDLSEEGATEISRTDIEAHTSYDHERGQKVKTMKIRGRILPMREVLPAGVELVDDDDGDAAATPERIPAYLVKQQAQTQQAALEKFRAGLATGTRSLEDMAGDDEDNLFDDEMFGGEHSILEAVSPAGPLLAEEREAVMLADSVTPTRKSPGPEYTWGGESPIPEHLAGFKWMSPTKIEGDKMPWDES